MKKILIFIYFLLLNFIFTINVHAEGLEVECEIIKNCKKNKYIAFLNYQKKTNEIENGEAKKNSNHIILFLPGGTGHSYFALTTKWIGELNKNIDIAVMIPGYKMPNPKGDPPLRYSKDYQEKIKSSVNYLKQKYKKSVWLMGHSAGGPGVAGFLKTYKNSEEYIAGAIFSGANSKSRSGSHKKNLPILIIHHKDDRCVSNSYSGAKQKLKKYQKTNNSVTKLVTIEGGGPFKNDPCKGWGNRHSFEGKEKEYAEAILKFIKENTK